MFLIDGVNPRPFFVSLNFDAKLSVINCSQLLLIVDACFAIPVVTSINELVPSK